MAGIVNIGFARALLGFSRNMPKGKCHLYMLHLFSHEKGGALHVIVWVALPIS
ncbi:hypothetical protein Syun_016438 [Stephania yunnanensis]|uniref:Uncharacterized protein n=1 Tax=Stephania yunnanensis TaxID=152371 RepID=A0AAP0J4V9_9MAGN